MRERTTWDRTIIANQLRRVAEDPRAMNQDHLQQQPAADDYLIGDGSPSEFAEDVHGDTQNWKAEQDGDGNTSRNEIGMPQMRSDTFNHPEKSPGSSPARGSRSASAEDEIALVHKKAELCTSIAGKMLKNASEQALEDQALELMSLPDSYLMSTYSRLASEDEDEGDDDEDEGQQAKEAGQQQDKASQQQDKQQAKESQDQDDEGQQDKKAKKAKKSGQQDQDKASQQQDQDKEGQEQQDKASQQQQAKKAGQQQDKQSQGQDKDEEEGQDKEAGQQDQDKGQDQDEDQGQDKEAAVMARDAAASLVTIPEGPARLAAMKAVAAPLFHHMRGKRAQMNQQGMQQLMSQVQQMIQQAMDQQMAQQQQKQMPFAQQQTPFAQQQQQPFAQQQTMSDDQLLDQLLQEDEYELGQGQGQQVFAEADIQMDTPTMDIGDVRLGAEDAVLADVFASGAEMQDAMKAAALQGHTSPLGNPQGLSRTASTRTVGTRPSEGVSQLGGASAPSGGSDVDRLSNLWSSAPDVSSVFR